jgi:hypothetical protein
MNPDLDDMDAPPRAANPAVKRADAIASLTWAFDARVQDSNGALGFVRNAGMH